MSNQYFKIATLLKPLGTEGEIKVNISDDLLQDLSNAKHLFIVQDGSYIPFFIEYVKISNHILLKLEDVDDPESALQFNLKDLYLTEKDISSKEIFLHKDNEQLIGYSVYDGTEYIGKIESIEIFPSQLMALVLYKGKTVYLPLADQLIIEIDDKASSVFMMLPDGILTI